MNTPKIKFLGVRFLRTALKSQYSLAGVVLQNRQEIDLIPEEGGGKNKQTKKKLHEIITRFGLPGSLQSDNGTSFTYKVT